ncbi:hypothetical protein ASF53_14190 [Methylobacterium sp. Leaf123]|nr:hypothetical protein ASF53_14190 [Methylobacterium sp. Leaf123]
MLPKLFGADECMKLKDAAQLPQCPYSRGPIACRSRRGVDVSETVGYESSMLLQRPRVDCGPREEPVEFGGAI